MEEGKNTPEKKFKAGSVVVTVWNNKAKNKLGNTVEFKTITAQRSYKSKDGDWKSTNTFRVKDIPKIIMLLNKAFEYNFLNENNIKTEETL